MPDCDVEVILLVNNGENAPTEIVERNQKTQEEALAFSKKESTENIQFYSLLHADLPAKHAGVGLARKIGMDEAAYRLESVGRSDGVIICYDADSNCSPNYLQEIDRHFKQFPKTTACSIYYEHPTSGDSFPEEVYTNIVDYELHLRYYVNALRWAGFPHAYQTIGSSMAVRCDAYQQQGGMNRKKAGEDFYFLHKFIPLGNFSELHSTMVIPSPRPSHRVPFGTGKAVQDMLDAKEELHKTYAVEIFCDLAVFLDRISELSGIAHHSAKAGQLEKMDTFLADLPSSVRDFLVAVSFTEKVMEIAGNTSTEKAFLNRFFQWFTAFLVLKFVHFARDEFYPNVEIGVAAKELGKRLWSQSYAEKLVGGSNLDLLGEYRRWDRFGK